MKNLYILLFALALCLSAAGLSGFSSAQESGLSRYERNADEIYDWVREWWPWAPSRRESDLARARDLSERANRLRSGDSEYGGGPEDILQELVNDRLPLPDMERVSENLGITRPREERIEEYENDARILITRNLEKTPDADKDRESDESDEEGARMDQCIIEHAALSPEYWRCMGNDEAAEIRECTDDHGFETSAYWRCMGNEQRAREVQHAECMDNVQGASQESDAAREEDRRSFCALLLNEARASEERCAKWSAASPGDEGWGAGSIRNFRETFCGSAQHYRSMVPIECTAREICDDAYPSSRSAGRVRR